MSQPTILTFQGSISVGSRVVENISTQLPAAVSHVIEEIEVFTGVKPEIKGSTDIVGNEVELYVSFTSPKTNQEETIKVFSYPVPSSIASAVAIAEHFGLPTTITASADLE